ncbi:hypothetical protein [Methylocystis sp.]|uniref:hypothetical protein n=1 Tax=Methylocystis sp. TaxID=1911079 RepID=UPI003DA2C083
MTPSELRIKNFLKRIPPNAPPAVARNVETALKLADRFSEKAAEIRANEKLSAQGKREQLLVMASGGFAGHWGQLHREANRALAGIAGEIAGLRKRARDSLGEFSASLQREVRDYLRSLNESDRRRLTIESQDPLVLSSILAAPAFLSGLNVEIYDHVEARVVESAFGARLTELKVDHDAWENAAAACEIAANEISREVGVTSDGFKKLGTPSGQSEAA